MYVYVELWNARPEWISLSEGDRKAFMGKVNGLLEELTRSRLSLMACVLNDGDTTPRVNYRYLAVWQMTDKSDVARLANGTAGIGWYKYFDQVNGGGEMVEPTVLIEEILNL